MTPFNTRFTRSKLLLLAALPGIGLVIANLDDLFAPDAVNATVYSIKQSTLSPVTGLPSLRDRPAGNRRYLVNGRPLLGRLAYSNDSPTRILNRLAAREASRTAALAAGQDRTDALAIRRILNQPLRVGDDNWGMYASVDWLGGGAGGTPRREDYLVLALRGAGESPTDVWTFQFPARSNPLDYFNREGESAPGVANSPVEPYPHATRIWSLSEFTDIGSGHVEIYHANGSVDGHSRHFIETLSAAGYKLKRDTPTGNQKRLLQFSGRGVDIDIMVARSDDTPGRITDVVQFRQ